MVSFAPSFAPRVTRCHPFPPIRRDFFSGLFSENRHDYFSIVIWGKLFRLYLFPFPKAISQYFFSSSGVRSLRVSSARPPRPVSVAGVQTPASLILHFPNALAVSPSPFYDKSSVPFPSPPAGGTLFSLIAYFSSFVPFVIHLPHPFLFPGGPFFFPSCCLRSLFLPDATARLSFPFFSPRGSFSLDLLDIYLSPAPVAIPQVPPRRPPFEMDIFFCGLSVGLFLFRLCGPSLSWFFLAFPPTNPAFLFKKPVVFSTSRTIPIFGFLEQAAFRRAQAQAAFPNHVFFPFDPLRGTFCRRHAPDLSTAPSPEHCFSNGLFFFFFKPTAGSHPSSPSLLSFFNLGRFHFPFLQSRSVPPFPGWPPGICKAVCFFTTRGCAPFLFLVDPMFFSVMGIVICLKILGDRLYPHFWPVFFFFVPSSSFSDDGNTCLSGEDFSC